MRLFVPAIAAAALLGAASIALAADATGTIKSLNVSKDMVTLDNGMTYSAPKSVQLSNFKVGEKVAITYVNSGVNKDMMTMKPAT